jgi:hypothetical protein
MVISALDLRKNPSNITSKACWLRIRERTRSTSLPQQNRFEIVDGSVTTFEEAVDAIKAKDSYLASHKIRKEKVLKAGGLGVALLVLEIENALIDTIQIAIPSHSELQGLPQSQDWGELWVRFPIQALYECRRTPRFLLDADCQAQGQ